MLLFLTSLFIIVICSDTKPLRLNITSQKWRMVGINKNKRAALLGKLTNPLFFHFLKASAACWNGETRNDDDDRQELQTLSDKHCHLIHIYNFATHKRTDSRVTNSQKNNGPKSFKCKWKWCIDWVELNKMIIFRSTLRSSCPQLLSDFMTLSFQFQPTCAL